MIEIKLIGIWAILNGAVCFWMLLNMCFDEVKCYDLNKKQWIFWTILIPGSTLAYLLTRGITLFFNWLSTENKNYCHNCKNNIDNKCAILNIEILKDKYLCEGKLYEKR